MPPTIGPCVALIPARAGSERIPGKNTRRLAGHPLLAYTIQAALDSGIFDRGVWVSSDSLETLDIAEHYGAHAIQRPASIATGDSPDIRWVRHALDYIGGDKRRGAFAILRPTSPFRHANTIRRAWQQFTGLDQTGDTLRAVEPAAQHPAKMWQVNRETGVMTPVLKGETHGVPWHSLPTQLLTPIYVQNASLEFCWSHTVYDVDRITGRKIIPFYTTGLEGVDLNTEADWDRAVALAGSGLPVIPTDPYPPRPGAHRLADPGRAVEG